MEQVEGLEDWLDQYGNPPSPAGFISAGTAQFGLLESTTGDVGSQSRQNFDGKNPAESLNCRPASPGQQTPLSIPWDLPW
ncbi:MAG: hypothetical protein J4N88_11170, partial [Chloroflexi bacterium]|nr:hypothetical protein [Chloroflexota bacterium]